VAHCLHDWDLSPAQARVLQTRLAGRVEREDRVETPRRVAGVDVGFEDGGRITRAAVCVLELPALAVCDTALARLPSSFPYIPWLLSFREVPAILAALERLSIRPDVLMCDGQGIAHPRRFGIACHLGVLLDLPSIGVAKSILTGQADAPGPARGDWSPLVDRGEVVGAALRTRAGVKPVYVSVGHRVCLASALALVMACTTSYRLPEPTRQADRLASRR
jgi:deoxyribonuclease V